MLVRDMAHGAPAGGPGPPFVGQKVAGGTSQINSKWTIEKTCERKLYQ